VRVVLYFLEHFCSGPPLFNRALTPLFDLMPRFQVYLFESLTMSTLAIWCRVVRSRDVRSRDFSVPVLSSF